MSGEIRPLPVRLARTATVAAVVAALLIAAVLVAAAVTHTPPFPDSGMTTASVVVLYLFASAFTGAVAGAFQPFIVTRLRAWLVGMLACLPYTFAVVAMVQGIGGLPARNMWFVLYVCDVVFGIIGGNLYWTDVLRRREWN
jgi:hypothetical protein